MNFFNPHSTKNRKDALGVLGFWGFGVLVNKDKEGKYATMVTSKFEKKILRIGISSSGFHQNVQVEFVY